MKQHDLDKQSVHYQLFLDIQQLILAVAGVEKTIKPRITTFHKNKKGICHLRTVPEGVDIGFLKGAKLKDQPKRLTGTGKSVRVLTVDSFEHNLITFYLSQAVALAK